MIPGFVISIGGGSIIDAGKAISAMIPIGEGVKDYLEGVGTKQHPSLKIPFIAVPTTAGTGSEATKNAVLSEPGQHGFKKSLRHERFVPDVAIIDPELTISCPPEVSMPVGMDAFTQLLEAFTSSKATPMTDLLALDGLKRATGSLPVVFDDPGNLEARTGMSYAALISGITLANAGLGVVHGFASAIGGMIPIPHGVVCGALLAPVTRANIQKLVLSGMNPSGLGKYVRAGQLFLNESMDDEFHLNMLIEKLTEWTSLFRIPKLRTYGLTTTDFEQIVLNTSLKNNPVKLDRDELLQILDEAT
jgi:alcohol dehydrogenase class IV